MASRTLKPALLLAAGCPAAGGCASSRVATGGAVAGDAAVPAAESYPDLASYLEAIHGHFNQLYEGGMPGRIARFHCSFAARPDVKHIPVMFSTSTPVCLSVPHALPINM